MSATETLKATPTNGGKDTVGRLFFLEASGGRIHSANADGSDRKVIVSGARVPDGVVVDVEAGHITGPTWAILARTMVRLSALISMARVA